MNSDFNGGRLSNLLFYYFESIVVVCYCLAMKTFSTPVFIVIVSYLIITSVFLFLTPIGILMKQSHYSRFVNSDGSDIVLYLSIGIYFPVCHAFANHNDFCVS